MSRLPINKELYNWSLFSMVFPLTTYHGIRVLHNNTSVVLGLCWVIWYIDYQLIKLFLFYVCSFSWCLLYNANFIECLA